MDEVPIVGTWSRGRDAWSFKHSVQFRGFVNSIIRGSRPREPRRPWTRGACAAPFEMNPGDRCQTDDELLAFARQYGHTAYHVVGTCKMGHDPRAVVDDELRVHGAASLRVVDASIMPRMTSGNTCPVAVERLIVDDAPDRGPKSRPVMDEGPDRRHRCRGSAPPADPPAGGLADQRRRSRRADPWRDRLALGGSTRDPGGARRDRPRSLLSGGGSFLGGQKRKAAATASASVSVLSVKEWPSLLGGRRSGTSTYLMLGTSDPSACAALSSMYGSNGSTTPSASLRTIRIGLGMRGIQYVPSAALACSSR